MMQYVKNVFELKLLEYSNITINVCQITVIQLVRATVINHVYFTCEQYLMPHFCPQYFTTELALEA